jgi:hypothetical protein
VNALASDVGNARDPAVRAQVEAEIGRLRALWRQRPDLFSPELVSILRDIGQALRRGAEARRRCRGRGGRRRRPRRRGAGRC